MKRLLCIACLLAVFLPLQLLALHEVELVKNFNTYPNRSYSGQRLVINGKLFFTNEDSDHGIELWILESENGTPELVKDINPGADPSYPDDFTLFNNKLFFTAYTEDHGYELWMSDGTEAGTQMVRDLNPGQQSSSPNNLTPFGAGKSRLGFRGQTDGIGAEFCISDGTSSGTSCFDLESGPNSSFPSDFVTLGDDLFFTAEDSTNGDEIRVMRSAGTGPEVLDLKPGSGSSRPYSLATFIATGLANTPALIFTAQTPGGEYEPYISFGTLGTTQLLKDIDGGNSSSPGNYFATSFGVLFTASTNAEGSELWKSDGTTAGTQLVKDINPGNGGSFISEFAALGNTIFFQASDGANGEELWKTNGSAAGTTLVKDIRPGEESSRPYNLLVVGNKLVFGAFTDELGQELYQSDGTSAGTEIVTDLRSGFPDSNPTDLFMYGSKVGFFGDGDDEPGLFFINPLSPGATTIIPLAQDSDGSAEPEVLAELPNGKILVSMRTAITGGEPHTVDPVTKEIQLLKDLSPGTNSSNFGYIGEVNGLAILSGEGDKSVGQELWATDGTPAGTFFLKDILPGQESSNPRSFGITEAYNGYLYFTAGTGEPDYLSPLYRTDGTPEGTSEFAPSLTLESPRNMVVALGGQLFFQAKTATSSGAYEIFKTDGTVVGTTQLTDQAVTKIDFYTAMHEHDGKLFFGAENADIGRELYYTDGTPGGLTLAADIITGPSGSFPTHFYSLGDRLLFYARPNAIGPSYYYIDPPYTQSDFALLVDPAPTNTIGGGGPFFEVFDKLLMITFTQITDNENSEPWITDGTSEGTEIFKIIQPGQGATEMSNWYEAGEYYYFAATKGDESGNELWRSDGTVNGTDLYMDLRPGAPEANPNLFGTFRGALYFTYEDDTIGKELWRIVFDECPDDLNKVEAGACGCGSVEDPTDTDGDGTPDCADSCSADALKITAGICGCGVADEDLDNSSVPDCLIAEELRIRSDLLAQLLDGFKRKPKKGRKKRVREIFQAYKDLDRYSRGQLDAFVNSTKKKTRKRLKNLRRKVKKFRKKSTNKNRRKTLKALARFLAIAP